MRQQLQQREDRPSPKRIEHNINQDEVQSSDISHRKEGTKRTKHSKRTNNDVLRNKRKKMDELKSAMKEKMTKNLDGMVKMTDSSFMTKVLKCPLPPKFSLP